MSEKWYIENPLKRLSGFELEEFNKTLSFFDEYLANSPESKKIVKDDSEYSVIIQSSSKDNQRNILFHAGLLNRGDVIEFDNYKWLVTDLPTDKYLYHSSKMTLCNASFDYVVQEGEQVYIGDDYLGRPRYRDAEPIVKTIPCVVENSVISYDIDQPINLPEGKLFVRIPYDGSFEIELGKVINIFNRDYRIYHIDYSLLLDNRGVLQLYVEMAK